MLLRIRLYLNRHLPQLGQVTRFGIVGVSGTVINTAMLWLFARLAGMPIVLASVLATEVAIINNFLLNDRWTFRSHARERPFVQRLCRFNVVALGGMAITVSIVYSSTTFAHIGLIAANLLAACATLVWNYLANSRWTWSNATVQLASAPPHVQNWDEQL